MFFIHTLELASHSTLPELIGLERNRDGFLALRSGQNQGWLLTPPISPRLAETWQGFEVFPDEVGVEVQVFGENHQPYRFTGTEWTIAPTPVWHSPATVRQGMPFWWGKIQFRVQLTRQNGRSPQVFGLSVGFEISRDLLLYVLEYTLPSTLSAPVTIVRQTQPIGDSTIVPLPDGIDPDLIQSPQVRMQSGQFFPATVTPDGIRTGVTLPAQVAQLRFTYPPHASHAPTFYQIDRLPTVLLRSTGSGNEQQLYPQTWLRLNSTELREIQSMRCKDVTVDVTVVAIDREEAHSIANQLMARISSCNFIQVPGWGRVLPCRVTRGVELNPGEVGGDLNRGTVPTVSFRLLLLQVPEGCVTRDRPLVAGIEPISPTLQNLDG